MISPVVDVAWVRSRRERVVLADVRWYLDGRSGREAFGRGHLPGAVFVDLDAWLAGAASPRDGRHPLPDPGVFARGMSGLGIADGDTVIGYDDAGGVVAARLVWMLRAIGHDAAVLDGGLAAWDGPWETEVVDRPTAVFTPRAWPVDRLADLDDAADPDRVVIDARDPARFRGDLEPIDARPGHIPGARSVPCRDNLDGTGRFLPPEVLRERFRAAGVVDGDAVVSYCGSGVTACHNLIALELAGLGAGRLYPGSWSQYSHRVDLPAAVGEA
jgi:thiosulfate/3-mercaptopyruvate sulfurtransferase